MHNYYSAECKYFISIFHDKLLSDYLITGRNHQLYLFKICMFMFKYSTKCVAPSVKKMFTTTLAITNRVTRQSISSKYYIPFTHLETVKKSLRRRGAKIRNFISDKIDIDCSICVFKHRIKKYLLQNEIPV